MPPNNFEKQRILGYTGGLQTKKLGYGPGTCILMHAFFYINLYKLVPRVIHLSELWWHDNDMIRGFW